MITKEELLANKRFQYKYQHLYERKKNYFFELKELMNEKGVYYITENYDGASFGHVCNVRQITNKGLSVYTSLIGKPIRAFIPFSDLNLYKPEIIKTEHL